MFLSQQEKNSLNFPKIQNQNIVLDNQRLAQNASQLVQPSKTPNPQLSLTSQLVSPQNNRNMPGMNQGT